MTIDLIDGILTSSSGVSPSAIPVHGEHANGRPKMGRRLMRCKLLELVRDSDRRPNRVLGVANIGGRGVRKGTFRPTIS
jgi:hypothetical protein